MAMLSGNLNDLKKNLEELDTALNAKRLEISTHTEKIYSREKAVVHKRVCSKR